MKKNLLCICLSIIILMGHTSCSQEVVYSCNEEANEWTKANLDVIQQMDRSEWVKLEYDYQKSTYNAFSGNQKITLWLGKIEEAMVLDWSVKEKNHINSLLQIVKDNPSWFSETFKNNESAQDNMTLTTYRWIEYATDTLKWDKVLIYAFIGTPQKILNKAGELDGTQITKGGPIGPSGPGGPTGQGSCSCSTDDVWCYKSDCVSYTDCQYTDGGCGTFWFDKCDGVCY